MDQELIVRLSAFFGVFTLMALLEILRPRRPLSQNKAIRWGNNLGIIVLDSLLVRLVFPTAAVGVAMIASEEGWGLMHMLEMPFWLAVPICVILLDAAIYGQHVLFHHVPILWRLHRMHHADQDYDVTTALRFHPIEILLSMLLKLAVVVALGAPALAVLIFEVLLNATAMFNHGNVKIPLGLDRWLRLCIVTPDMHRVHHSVIMAETNSNYGFNLPWWDRLFGTYRAQPEAGHEGMIIGLYRFRSPQEQWLHAMLIQPFKGPANDSEGPETLKAE